MVRSCDRAHVVIAWLAAVRAEVNAARAGAAVAWEDLQLAAGILLIEHAQHELARGADLEFALGAAARRRLRPILMTTGATLAGLSPLALGSAPAPSSSAPWRSP